MKDIVKIRLKDICYYEDNFEYNPIYVIKNEKFEENINKLKEICENYDSFQEIDDFIDDNFEKIDIEEIEFEI